MKHPVPKKRKSRARTRRQHAAFVAKKQKQLVNKVVVRPCGSCGAPKLHNKVCPTCGKFRGREVVSFQKKVDKITKIKA